MIVVSDTSPLTALLTVGEADLLPGLFQYARIVDAGEAEAIELARELRADRLLIDERKGRRLAVEEGVPVIGLLGVVLLAKRRQVIPSARALLQRLENEAGMHLSEDIKNVALKTVGE